MSLIQQAPHPIAILDDLESVERRVASATRIALFLDFDGTISPIVSKPRDAKIDPAVLQILNTLIARPDCNVAIVSGRALSDLRERVGLTNVIYAGNHGLEIESDSCRFREPAAEALRRELRCVFLQLKLALSDTDGVEIEDKALTLSVHFRRVAEQLHDWVRSVTSNTVARSRSFVCQEGKMVLDLRPRVRWNKGHAIRWIARQVLPPSSLPIFIGDDVTDEDGFAALPEGITIRVGGPAETEAQYTLPDVAAVGRFLTWLNHAKPHASLANSQRAGR